MLSSQSVKQSTNFLNVKQSVNQSMNQSLITEVDDDDDEDDEGDWEEGAEELIDKKSTYDGPTARELESNRRLNEMLK